MSTRKNYSRLAEFYYENIELNSNECVYCGMPADTKDHLIPLSVMANLADLNLDLNSFKVTSCSECNSLAGSVFFTSFKDKKLYIKYKLTQKYHKVLSIPEWSEEEILEMGPRAREDIRNHLCKQKIILERMDFQKYDEILIEKCLTPAKIKNSKYLQSTNSQILTMSSIIIMQDCAKTIGEWCLYTNTSLNSLTNKLDKGFKFDEIFKMNNRKLNTIGNCTLCLAIEKNITIMVKI